MFKLCYFMARCCLLLPFLPWLLFFRINQKEYVIGFVYLVNSLLTLLFYAADKQNAERGEWRIPEACLHCWELLFGWPGALLGQRLFHHKNRKFSFLLIFWLCVIINVASTIFLLKIRSF